jgi:hypothetical protein
LITFAMAFFFGCGPQDESDSVGPASAGDLGKADQAGARDSARHPSVLEIDDCDDIFAVSDPHGGYLTLLQLLRGNGLVGGSDDAQPSAIAWTGGTHILLVAGDLIDKGARSIEVIDLLRSLQPQAARVGGRVIVTMGNHEAEFLADPENKKAMSVGTDKMGIDNELAAQGIAPEQLARGRDAEGRGRWLIQLPLAVRIKKWFFSHGGNTGGRSIAQLERRFDDAIAQDGFGAKEIIGDHSILEEQLWFGDPDKGDAGKDDAAALGVKHLVFGHDPGGLNGNGQIKMSRNGVLFDLDCAMGLTVGGALRRGYLLHITTRGEDRAETLDDQGRAEALLYPGWARPHRAQTN